MINPKKFSGYTKNACMLLYLLAQRILSDFSQVREKTRKKLARDSITPIYIYL